MLEVASCCNSVRRTSRRSFCGTCEKCSGEPAPLEAMTGMVTAFATASTSSVSKPLPWPSLQAPADWLDQNSQSGTALAPVTVQRQLLSKRWSYDAGTHVRPLQASLHEKSSGARHLLFTQKWGRAAPVYAVEEQLARSKSLGGTRQLCSVQVTALSAPLQGHNR